MSHSYIPELLYAANAFWNVIGSAKWEAANDVRVQENLEKLQHISHLLWPATPANTGSGGAHPPDNQPIDFHCCAPVTKEPAAQPQRAPEAREWVSSDAAPGRHATLLR
jgi:hypothetical protein